MVPPALSVVYFETGQAAKTNGNLGLEQLAIPRKYF